MYIGHVGAALAGKRVRTSIGLLPLLVATYTPDWVDTGMCLAGAYSPHEMLSHSVPAVLVLALLGFSCYSLVARDWTGGLIIAAVILSHMLLDWITGDAANPKILFDGLREEVLPDIGRDPATPSDVPQEPNHSPIFIRDPVYGTRCSTGPSRW